MMGAIKSIAAYKAPQPIGYVNDFAHVLSDDSVQKLNGIIKELETKTGTEVVVVTLKSLEGYPIEDVGLTIGRQWKIGQKGKNNGVVIVTAINDRKLRIEVGYGIEAYLTDGQAGRIRDSYMIPYFQKGDYKNGIIYGTSAVVSNIAKGYGVTISGNYQLPQSQEDMPDGYSIFIFFLFIFLFIRYPSFMSGVLIGNMSSGRYYTGGGGFGGSSGFGGFGGSGGFGGGGSSGGW